MTSPARAALPAQPPYAAMAAFVTGPVSPQHSGGAVPMPTPTPKRRMTLQRLAQRVGLRKIQKVDYSAKKAQPAAQQDRHKGAYDLQA